MKALLVLLFTVVFYTQSLAIHVSRVEFVSLIGDVIPFDSPIEPLGFADTASLTLKQKKNLFAYMQYIGKEGRGESFHPDRIITVAEASVFLNRWLQIAIKEPLKPKKSARDIQGHWAKPAIEQLLEAGIFEVSKKDGYRYVYPKRKVTETEAEKWVARTKTVISKAQKRHVEKDAEDQIVKGYAVMAQVANQYRFHTSQVSKVQLLVTAKKKRNRKYLYYVMKHYKKETGELRSMIKCIKPLRKKGEALLTIEKDDILGIKQWEYIPSSKSVSQLSKSGRKAPFMDSDFSYGDMGGRHLDLDVHEFIKEDPLYYYINSTPKSSEDNYAYLQLQISKEKLLPEKIVYYKRFGKSEPRKLKTLYNHEIAPLEGGYVIKKSVMVNHFRKGQTQITVEDIKLGIPLSDEQFSQKAMTSRLSF